MPTQLNDSQNNDKGTVNYTASMLHLITSASIKSQQSTPSVRQCHHVRVAPCALIRTLLSSKSMTMLHKAYTVDIFNTQDNEPWNHDQSDASTSLYSSELTHKTSTLHSHTHTEWPSRGATIESQQPCSPPTTCGVVRLHCSVTLLLWDNTKMSGLGMHI